MALASSARAWYGLPHKPRPPKKVVHVPAIGPGLGNAEEPTSGRPVSSRDLAALRWATAAMIAVGLLTVGAIAGAVRAARAPAPAPHAVGQVAAGRLVLAAKRPSPPVAAAHPGPVGSSVPATIAAVPSATAAVPRSAAGSSLAHSTAVPQGPAAHLTATLPVGAVPAPASSGTAAAPSSAPAGRLSDAATLQAAAAMEAAAITVAEADAAAQAAGAPAPGAGCAPRNGQPCWDAANATWYCPDEVTGAVAPCTPAELHTLQAGLPWYVKAQDCIVLAGCQFGTRHTG